MRVRAAGIFPCRRGGSSFGWHAEAAFTDEVDKAFDVGEAGCFGAVVGGGDEDVDVVFVGGEEGVDVGLVDETGALGLGEDEVGEEEEAQIGVEGEPGCAVSVV